MAKINRKLIRECIRSFRRELAEQRDKGNQPKPLMIVIDIQSPFRLNLTLRAELAFLSKDGTLVIERAEMEGLVIGNKG